MNLQSKSRGFAAAFGIAGVIVLGVAFAGPHGDGGRHRFAFEQADADRDGRVTLAEAEAAKVARMAGIDADNDGYVTFEEARAHRQALREQRARARFAGLDANADGRVSVDEVAARADDHTARLFAHLDRNDDGAIATDELPPRLRGAR